MPNTIAKIISTIFHPILLPTLGILLLLNTGFHFSMISWEAKRYILFIIIFATAVLPLLSVAILALNPKFNLSMPAGRDRVIPLLSSSVCYYIGYLLLNKLRAFPVFKIFLIASVILIIVILLISFSWKISIHMAAIGGLTGTFFALSFRYGMNPLWILVALVLISGVVGTARLALKKHNIWQIVLGYLLGIVILYLVIYFV